MFVSLLSIFSIAIDRYVLTVHPFKHRVLLNGRRIAIWIVSIWLLSLCLLVKYLAFGLNQMDNKIYDAIFIIIAVVSSLIYVLIYFSLRRQQRDISQQSRSRNRALQEEFVKTIMIVAFIQIFTLVPTSVHGLIYGWSRDSSVVNLIFFEMYFVNFAINPFLYIWRLKNYRKTFRLILCRKLR
jgi:ABC-type Fe3+ transport system permease subunit